ncbi:hypothetical protein [Sphingomonas sp. MMS24-J13]|uniref:hypothetical protein n=1 Tax=Sphingomonas sp. MMS24-J13 TaxID=3238686 RepID=UPI0038504387
MNLAKMEECLALLRKADDLLMEDNELAIAVHVSRAIEDLAARIDGQTSAQHSKPA